MHEGELVLRSINARPRDTSHFDSTAGAHPGEIAGGERKRERKKESEKERKKERIAWRHDWLVE